MDERFEVHPAVEYRRAMNDQLTVDPARTVVLTVDMQQDYLDTELGTSPLAAADARRVIATSAALLASARARGIPVVHVYVSRRRAELERGFDGPVYGNVSRDAGLSQNAQAPARTGPSRLAGTRQAELPPEVVAPEDVHVTTKRVLDGYFDTDLDMLLRRVFRPDTVVLTGINTDTCVYATTIATSCRGYRPVVISDCVASTRGPESHAMALELMARSIAWVLTAEEFQAQIDSAAPAGVSAAPVG
jgi:nicotinamidase-related amidase